MSAPSTSLHARRDEHTTALIVIDMVSTWRFPDSKKLLPAACRITPAIVRLKARCKALGVPVIYANDNLGRWRSDWPSLMKLALSEGGDGARIAEQLAPDSDDYFVLKPMQSAFFGTPLEMLLQHLQVRHVVLAGVASDQCVLTTAATARMFRLDVSVPRDAVAAQTPERTRASLRHFEDVLKLRTTSGARLRLEDPST